MLCFRFPTALLRATNFFVYAKALLVAACFFMAYPVHSAPFTISVGGVITDSVYDPFFNLSEPGETIEVEIDKV